MGTMQDKLGRGVVYAGCVGFGSPGGPRRCGERTECGKMFRRSGPKKQTASRPASTLLFGPEHVPVPGWLNLLVCYRNNYSTFHIPV
jgi:hypothetical protein